MGEVGWHAERAPTRFQRGALLNGRNALFLVMVYLVVTSINNLTPVASRVICGASPWNRPVLSAVTMVCLVWTWHGQTQWLWASVRVLMHRHALCPCLATYGDLGRTRGMPEATWGLP